MTDDLDELMALMRSAGCRSSEKRLRRTAIKRLATAARHQETAAAYRADVERGSAWPPELRQREIEAALRLDVRAAERRGEVTRAVREVAFRLVPGWTAGHQDLLDAAQAVAEPTDATVRDRMPLPTASPIGCREVSGLRRTMSL